MEEATGDAAAVAPAEGRAAEIRRKALSRAKSEDTGISHEVEPENKRLSEIPAGGRSSAPNSKGPRALKLPFLDEVKARRGGAG